MATPEGRVKTGIRQWLEDHQFWRAGGAQPPQASLRGWYYQPQNMGMGAGGVPDFVGSYFDGDNLARPFAIEAKAPGKVRTKGEGCTEQQLDRHAEMRAAGWFVLVVDDVSQLAELEKRLG